MHTEQDAKERWCPFVRYSAGDEAGANRWKQSEPTPHALNPVPCRCIASECMAWRWGPVDWPRREPPETALDLWKLKDEPERPLHVPPHWRWIPGSEKAERAARWQEPDAEAEARRKGYCGLAGTAMTRPPARRDSDENRRG